MLENCDNTPRTGPIWTILDESDRCNPPILLIPFSRLHGICKSEVDCTAISKVWTTGMLVDKRAIIIIY